MTAHIFTYDLHRMRCGELSRARSDTASAASIINTGLKCFKQPREDLLSVIALKIIGAHRWSTLPVRNDGIVNKKRTIDGSSVPIQ